MLTVTYPECPIQAPCAECRYAECRYAECLGTLELKNGEKNCQSKRQNEKKVFRAIQTHRVFLRPLSGYFTDLSFTAFFTRRRNKLARSTLTNISLSLMFGWSKLGYLVVRTH